MDKEQREKNEKFNSVMNNAKPSESDIKKLVALIPNSRTAKREIVTARVLDLFISLNKERCITQFPREHLNFFVSKNISKQQKELIVTALLKQLIADKRIKEERIVKAIYSYRIKSLGSFDYGSYDKMMTANGYKRKLFKFENKNGNGITKRLVKSLGIGEEIPTGLDFNHSEIKSTKPQAKQKVTSTGNKSQYLNFHHFFEKKVYLVN